MRKNKKFALLFALLILSAIFAFYSTRGVGGDWDVGGLLLNEGGTRIDSINFGADGGILWGSATGAITALNMTEAQGDILIFDTTGTDSWTRLAQGTLNQILKMQAGGLPGWGSETGDIEGVTAGSGLGGGGTSGTVTLNALVDWGLVITDDSLNADSTVIATQYDISEAVLEGFLDLQDLQGAVTDAQVPDNITITDNATQTWVGAGYQPLEATLTDIADGTIAENLVNTANPWADNEIASSATWNARLDTAVIVTWPDSANELATNYDLSLKSPLASPTFTGTVTIPTPFTLGAVSVTPTGTELNFVDGVTSAIQTQLDAKQPLEATLTDIADGTITENLVNTTNPWADNEIASSATWNNRLDSAAILTWPDTTATIATAYDLTLKAGYNRPIQFSITNPKNEADTIDAYENRTGAAMTIDSIFALSYNDSCAFSLVELGRTGGSVSLIDAVDANTAGTNRYYKTETTISDNSVAAGSVISYVKSTDSTEVIKVVIYWK